MCEGCGRKRATHYLCQPGAVPETINLCDECMETHAPGLVKAFMEDLRGGRCRFCGGQAAATDSIARAVEGAGTEEKFLCLSCCAEYYRAGLQYWDVPSDPTHWEVDEQLKLNMEKLDAHMEQWVRQRDN